MITDTFSITQEQQKGLSILYPNIGKNSHIEKLAVEIVKLYFISKNPDTIFSINQNVVDLSTTIDGVTVDYEIKGTEAENIAWAQLKVSSKNCYDRLLNGMTLIRITNIRSLNMTLHFLKHNEDFEMHEEPRWSVRRRKLNT